MVEGAEPALDPAVLVDAGGPSVARSRVEVTEDELDDLIADAFAIHRGGTGA